MKITIPVEVTLDQSAIDKILAEVTASIDKTLAEVPASVAPVAQTAPVSETPMPETPETVHEGAPVDTLAGLPEADYETVIAGLQLVGAEPPVAAAEQVTPPEVMQPLPMPEKLVTPPVTPKLETDIVPAPVAQDVGAIHLPDPAPVIAPAPAPVAADVREVPAIPQQEVDMMPPPPPPPLAPVAQPDPVGEVFDKYVAVDPTNPAYATYATRILEQMYAEQGAPVTLEDKQRVAEALERTLFTPPGA